MIFPSPMIQTKGAAASHSGTIELSKPHLGFLGVGWIGRNRMAKLLLAPFGSVAQFVGQAVHPLLFAFDWIAIGAAIAVSDEAILESQRQLASMEGIFAAPEGAATLAALKDLIKQGWLQPEERIVLFNTGSGLKYLEYPNQE